LWAYSLDLLPELSYIYQNFEKLINTKKGRRYITAAPNLQRNIRESKNFPSSRNIYLKTINLIG
jgi:hypothetical protein